MFDRELDSIRSDRLPHFVPPAPALLAFILEAKWSDRESIALSSLSPACFVENDPSLFLDTAIRVRVTLWVDTSLRPTRRVSCVNDAA